MNAARKSKRYLIFAAILFIALTLAALFSQGGVAYAENVAPVITLVSQSSNDVYARAKSAYLTFEDISTEETNGIIDVTLDGESLGAITEYNLTVSENGSHTFVATNYALLTSTLTVTFEKVHTTEVSVSSNLGIGVQSGGGEYTGGEAFTVSTSLVSGYYFTGWTFTGSSSGSVAELSKTIQIGEPQDSFAEYSYIANYAPIDAQSPPTYTYYSGAARPLSFTPPQGYSATISYMYNRDADGYWLNRSVTEPVEAGEYTATVSIVNNATLETVGQKAVVIRIDRGTIDTLSLPNGNFTYDGNVKRLNVSGAMPDGSAVAVRSWQNNALVNVGSITDVSAIVRGGNNFYDLTLTGGILTVQRRPVTITALDKLKQYGYQFTQTKRALEAWEEDPFSFEFYVSGGLGIVSGESLSGCFALHNPDVATGFSTAILQGSVDNDTNPNYDITFIGATLTAVQRNVRILIENEEYEYGEPIPAHFAYTLQDTLANGETLSGEPQNIAEQGAGAGIYPFSHSFEVKDSLLIDTTENYNFILTSSDMEILPPHIEITPRRLIIAATQNQSLTYNGQRQLPEYELLRPEGGDALYADDVLDCYVYADGVAAVSANAGRYTLVLGGADYRFFADGQYAAYSEEIAFIIQPKEISAVIYTGNGDLIYNGLEQKNIFAFSPDVYPEDTDFTLSINYSGNMKDAGSYTYYAYIDYSHEGNRNYFLSPALLPGTLTIYKKNITVTAENKSRKYGHQNPALSYSAAGLAQDDALYGTLATVAGLNSPVGSYPITIGTLNNPNYEITFIEDVLEILREDLILAAEDKQRLYYENNPQFTYTVTQGTLLPGTQFSGQLLALDTATQQIADKYSPCGQYAISGNLTNPNYNVEIISGTLTVSPRPLEFTFYNDNIFLHDGLDKKELVHVISHNIPEPVGEGISYTLIKSSPAEWNAAGSYTFTVLLFGEHAGNYVWDNDRIFTVKISLARALVTVANQVVTFGESINPALYSIVSENTGAVMSANLTLTALPLSAGDRYNAIGVAEKTAVINSVTYDLVVFKGNLTVLKRPLSLSWGETHLLYNGTPQSPPSATLTGGYGDISVIVATDYPLHYPGSYTATAIFVGADKDNHYLPSNTSVGITIAKAPTVITKSGDDNSPVFSATGDNRELTYSVNGSAFATDPPVCPKGVSTKIVVRAAENECYLEGIGIFVIDRAREGDEQSDLVNKLAKTPASYIEIDSLGAHYQSDIYDAAGYIASAIVPGQIGGSDTLAWQNTGAGDQYFALFYFNVAITDEAMASAASDGQLRLTMVADWYSDFISSAFGWSNTDMLFAAAQTIASPYDYTLCGADNTFNNKQYSLSYSPALVGLWAGVNGYEGIFARSIIHEGNAAYPVSAEGEIIFDTVTLPGRYFRIYLGIAVTSNSREYGSDYNGVNAGIDNYGIIDSGFSAITLSITKEELAPVLLGDTPYTKITADNKYPANGAKTYSFVISAANNIAINESNVIVNTNNGALTAANGGLSFVTLNEHGSIKKVATRPLAVYTLITSVTIKDAFGEEYTLTHSHNEANTHYFDPPQITNVSLSDPGSAGAWVSAAQTLSFYVSAGNGAPVTGVTVNGQTVYGTEGWYTFTLTNASEFTLRATNAQNLSAEYKGRALIDLESPYLSLSHTHLSGVWMPEDFSALLSVISTSSLCRIYYRRAPYGTLPENAVWYEFENAMLIGNEADFMFWLTADGAAQDTVYQFKIVNGVGMESDTVVFNYKVDRRSYRLIYIDKWHDGTDFGEYSEFLDSDTLMPAAGAYTRGTQKSVTIKSLVNGNTYYGLQLSMITVTNTASATAITFTSIEEYLEFKSNYFILSVDNPNVDVAVTVTAIFKNYVLYKINDASKDFGDNLPAFSVTPIKGVPEVGTTQYGITTEATAQSPMGQYTIYAPVRTSTSQILCYLDGILTITARKVYVIGASTKVYDKTDVADTSMLSLDRVLEGDEVYISSAYFALGQVNVGTHPLDITLDGADSYRYRLAVPPGQDAYYGEITPYGLIATGGQTITVFDGAIKHYRPEVSGVLPGDEAPEFTYIYENNAIPVFANYYRAIDCVSSDPNYTIISYPEGIHLTITPNNNLSAKRIITPSGGYCIMLILHEMASAEFADLPDPQIIYSVNGSSFFKIEQDRYSAVLVGDMVEITYLGRPGMREDLADIYSFQIGVDDDFEFNDSTNFTFTASALSNGQADSYYSSGTPIYTAEDLKAFLAGTGNGYLCNNIYDFDWGGGGSVLVFETGRVLDGNGFTVYFTGDYELNEMTQPATSFTSFKSWYASGLFVGINHGTIQNINFKYSCNRYYLADTCNSANSGRAIGFISGANTGTIRNTVITLAGNFLYNSSLGISFGFLAVGGITGVAYEYSTIINCTVEHIAGTYTFTNHANNTKTYLAFGGAVGFMNGNSNTVKTDGYYNNAALINRG
jgi:hypothetical protein